ncbi:MAG: tRNA (cytidine(34)-2'-O)-methyltransferase [Gammaproteobacteria bacterium]|nr:tRNA (cytidine(34)-2'-O)-methyltransferase [Gammaproteobacteria bacterium]
MREDSTRFSKRFLNIVLYQPEIPPNTGNTIRLAANTGASLTLVEPLGFEMDDRRLRRAGLDYDEWVNVRVCSTLSEALAPFDPKRVFAFSTKASRSFTDVEYQPYDVLMFGPETRGLPASLRARFESNLLRIPMLPQSRSMNMANSVAVALYEAWRQLDFTDGR